MNQHLVNPGQQVATVRIPPLIICGGEMPPHISHGDGSQQRVAQSVQSDITVRVRFEAPGVRYPHTAEHDVIPRGEGVHIQSLAYPEVQDLTPSRIAAAK
jgi:hypothetical protein